MNNILFRSEELNRIDEAYELAISGENQVLMVSGESGSGKSVLVYKAIRKKDCFFIAGKFDEYSVEEPYSGFKLALSQIAHQLLIESDEKLSNTKKQLKTLLSQNIGCLLQLLPEFTKIVGEHEYNAEDDFLMNQSKIFHEILRLLKFASNKRKCLVLFLDDLQWADDKSLELLAFILDHFMGLKILIIGAYRSEEVDENDPLTQTIDSYKSESMNYTHIDMKNFTIAQIEQYIELNLHIGIADKRVLSQIIYAKTLGNPLYVKKYLDILQEEKHIYQDDNNEYKLNMDAIHTLDVVSDVVSMISYQVSILDEHLVHVLKVAQCMGTIFNNKVLSAYYDRYIQHSHLSFNEVLDVLVRKGLVHRRDSDTLEYQFTHDKVIQSVYVLMDKSEIASLCRRIGDIYLSEFDQGYIDAHIIRIMSYYLLGEPTTNDTSLQVYVKLFLSAAQKSVISSAYIEAQNFSKAGLLLLPENSINRYYDLICELELIYAQCTYINGDEEGIRLFKVLERKLRSNTEKANLHNLIMVLYYCRGKHSMAIEEGLIALKYMGVHVPRKFETIDLIVEVIQTLFLYRNSRIDKLIEKPETSSKRLLKILEIIVNISTAANVIDDRIFERIILKGSKLTAKYGNSEFSIMGYAGYAIVCSTVFGQYEKSKKLTEFVEILEEKYGYKSYTCFCELALGAFVTHYTDHITQSIYHLKRCSDIGFELGDYSTMGFAIPTEIEYKYFYGESLEDLSDCVNHYRSIKFDLHESELSSAFMLYSKVIKNFTQAGVREDLYDELIYDYIKREDNTGIKTYYYVAAHQDFIYGEYDRAFETIVKSIRTVKDIKGFMASFDFYFLYGLLIGKKYDQATLTEKSKYKKSLKKCIKRLKKWSKQKSGNFYHKYCLLQGELLRIQGHSNSAKEYYELAIDQAGKHQFNLNQAIAYENYANFFYSIGDLRQGNLMYKESVSVYETWGALGKVYLMKENMPGLFETNTISQGKVLQKNVVDENFNLLTFIDDILNESNFDIMLSKVVNKLIELVGGTRGAIILEYNNEYIVKGSNDESLMSVNIEESIRLPKTIIRYVSRTYKCIRYEKNHRIYLFNEDQYIEGKTEFSSICVPLLLDGIFVGMIYLENDVLTNAFGDEIEEYIKSYSLIIASSIKLKMTSQDTIEKSETKNDTGYDLTTREIEVITLAADGLTNKEISENLQVSLSTVKTHLLNAFSKLEVNNRIKAVIKAQKLGFLGD